MIDFPDSPSLGEIYKPPTSDFTYQFNGDGWRVAGGGASALGGMNLFESVDLTGLPNYDVQLVSGFDYEFRLTGVKAITNGNHAEVQLSPDGAVFNSSEFDRVQRGGASGDSIVSNGGALPALITRDLVVPFTRESLSTWTVWDFDNASLRTKFMAVMANVTVSGAYAYFNVDAWHTPLQIDTHMRVVLGGTVENFQGGRFDVYRRSRQPISFLTGREPGGMYLHQEIVAAGSETEFIGDLLDGYDYEFKILNMNPSSSQGQLQLELSTVGIAGPWSAACHQSLDGNVQSVPTALANTGTGTMFVGGTQEASRTILTTSAEFSIDHHDRSNARTIVEGKYDSYNGGQGQLGFAYRYAQTLNQLSKAWRLTYPSLAFLNTSTIRVYRRNRLITF